VRVLAALLSAALHAVAVAAILAPASPAQTAAKDLRLTRAEFFAPTAGPVRTGSCRPYRRRPSTGTLTIHTDNLPVHLNVALTRSTYARRILRPITRRS